MTLYAPDQVDIGDIVETHDGICVCAKSQGHPACGIVLTKDKLALVTTEAEFLKRDTQRPDIACHFYCHDLSTGQFTMEYAEYCSRLNCQHRLYMAIKTHAVAVDARYETRRLQLSEKG